MEILIQTGCSGFWWYILLPPPSSTKCNLCRASKIDIIYCFQEVELNPLSMSKNCYSRNISQNFRDVQVSSSYFLLSSNETFYRLVKVQKIQYPILKLLHAYILYLLVTLFQRVTKTSANCSGSHSLAWWRRAAPLYETERTIFTYTSATTLPSKW